jgi:cytochrome c oxidase subunit 2
MRRALIALATAYASIVAMTAFWRPHVEPAALEIHARTVSGYWDFTYPSGLPQRGRLFLPNDRPATVIVTTDEAPEWCFIPNLHLFARIARGKEVSFRPKVGEALRVYCTRSSTEIRPVPPEDFDPPPLHCSFPLEPRHWGEELVVQNGCTTCHSRDGTASVGPTFKGLFGSSEELATGAIVVVDKDYIRESIRSPQAKIVHGYEGPEGMMMPTFTVSDRQIDAMVAYLATLE